jgi:ABC-type multidrug transport system fused ATPase/permease subunit
MTKVYKNPYNSFYLADVCQVASEALSALRTVQSFNAVPQEERKFHDKVSYVLTLARREAIASGIFFGSTGWSGNVTLLGLLGYGRSSEFEPIENGLKTNQAEPSCRMGISQWETLQVSCCIRSMSAMDCKCSRESCLLLIFRACKY